MFAPRASGFMKPDSPQLARLQACVPFPSTILLVTDGREKAALINFSIDFNFSVKEIDLLNRKGRADGIRGNRRTNSVRQLAAHKCCPELRSPDPT